MLGWDNLDTALHLDDVADKLTHCLVWPENENDIEEWRKAWRSAFTLRNREVINTSRELSTRLAELARALRNRIRTALDIESESGPLTKLMKAFRESLVHDLDADGFADMYAQTIAYGLLTARIANPKGVTADDLHEQMPVTNPFLKELMETFLHVGGRQRKDDGRRIDFDELGVSEVVDLLDDANMEAVVRDFGDRNPQEDPVIHFYELFLKEYDAKKRMQRGVFYTPRPVVSYIVRSVDELLRTEFGLEDGLADITTWGELAKCQKDLTIPEGVAPDQAFVQILDPATGTGTFLVEVIDIIHKTLATKWTAEGCADKEMVVRWNDYVRKHLLPRLHGYELLMAPYAIAHLKIGLKLFETGYLFASEERARVYLTNALEPASDFADAKAASLFEALGHEAQAVNEIKQSQRFTVVIGNPPYSGVSANLAEQMRRSIDPYRYVNGVKIKEKGALQFEKNLNDDYVKFVRFAERQVEGHSGILGFITNNGFLDSATLRGMRNHLLNCFSRRWFINLHGDADKREVSPTGQPDENVFEIKRGVTISLLVRPCSTTDETLEVKRCDFLGTAKTKNAWLREHVVTSTSFISFDSLAPNNYFFPQDAALVNEYACAVSVAETLSVNSTGFESGRDEILTAFTRAELLAKLEHFSTGPSDEIRQMYSVEEAWGKKLFDERKSITTQRDYGQLVIPFLFGPFDVRFCFYRKDLLKTNSYSAGKHLLGNDNVALMVMRQVSLDAPFTHA